MGKGNFDIGVEAQNKKNQIEAKEKLEEIKHRDCEMYSLNVMEIINGRKTIREYHIPTNLSIEITDSPCRCLIRKIYHETYVVTLDNCQCDTIIDLYKDLLRTKLNEEKYILLGQVIEKYYLESNY